MDKKSVSIIIPAYNEEKRLPQTLRSISDYFKREHPFYLEEVIVINDGSKDNTKSIAESFKSQIPIKVIDLKINRGKGHAVRAGMLTSMGDYSFIYDADGATPLYELERIFKQAGEDSVVIGSRILGKEKKVSITPFRRFVGWCFHIICSGLLPGISDASCGAKLFSRKAVREFFPRQKLERFAFDIEILWLSRRLGFTVKEVSVNWSAVPGSKVNIARDSLEMLWSVIWLYKRQIIEDRINFAKVKKHYLALTLAFLVGICYVAPHLYFMNSLGEEYKGIYMSRAYDEDYYNSIVRQVYDGVPITHNPHIFEYKDKSISTMYNYTSYIQGKVGTILNLNISELMVWSKFVFPALLFLVVYFFILSFTGNVVTSAVSALGVLLFEELAPLNIDSLIKTYSFQSPFRHFLFFSRPINPQLSAILFFSILNIFSLFWKDYKSKKNQIILGLSVGVLGYIYFYYWDFALILLGVLLLYSVISRNKSMAKGVFVSLIFALLASALYLFDMFGALLFDGSSVQKNYVLTHRFILEKVILLPLLIILFFWFWNYVARKWSDKFVVAFSSDNKYKFLFLLLFTGLLASNQQVIHGFEAQQHHYHFMINIPLFIISIFTIFSDFILNYLNRFRKIIFTLVTVFIFIGGISVQASSYRYWSPIFIEYQSYSTFFDWLNSNTKINDVVYTGDVLSELVPVYTHNSVYSSLHTSVYPLPLERLEHNYFIYMYLEGIRENNIRNYMYNTENRNRIGQYIYEGQYWRAVCGSFGCFPDSVLDDLIIKYNNFLKTDFQKNLKKYRVDYILWDKNENPRWGIDKLGFVKEILKNEEVYLYSVNN